MVEIMPELQEEFPQREVLSVPGESCRVWDEAVIGIGHVQGQPYHSKYFKDNFWFGIVSCLDEVRKSHDQRTRE